MAHFAELDDNNVVLRVVVTDNAYPNEGYDWLVETFGGRWIQTSYSGSFRKNFAAVGFTYNEALDAFIEPKPFESWTLDETRCVWVPPTSRPKDEKRYYWNEEIQTWSEIND